jgi:hypothetical protein
LSCITPYPISIKKGTEVPFLSQNEKPVNTLIYIQKLPGALGQLKDKCKNFKREVF